MSWARAKSGEILDLTFIDLLSTLPSNLSDRIKEYGY
jgi:hypothetical protein